MLSIINSETAQPAKNHLMGPKKIGITVLSQERRGGNYSF
jgi:hypothetical protein